MSMFVIDELEAEIESLDRIVKVLWEEQHDDTFDFYCELCNRIDELWKKRDDLIEEMQWELSLAEFDLSDDEIPF